MGRGYHYHPSVLENQEQVATHAGSYFVSDTESFVLYRLSRDEKLFNRDLEQALAKSENSSLSSAQGDQSITAGSPSRLIQPVDDSSRDPLDDSDYFPGSKKYLESDDEDFEPSPPAKKPKKSEGKEKRKPVKKENTKTAAKSARANCKVSTKPSVSTVRGSDLPGSRPPARLPTAPKTDLQSKVGLQTSTRTDAAQVKRKGVAKWVPPARVGHNAGGSITPVRSGGGAPAIRIGLSRKAPIKPLHSLQSPVQTKN